MDKVRTITIVGFAISVASLMFLLIDLRIALLLGAIGMAISIRNLMTAE